MADGLSSSQCNVPDRSLPAFVKAKHDIRLEVTMVDTQTMAELDRVEQLEENVFYQAFWPRYAVSMKDCKHHS